MSTTDPIIATIVEQLKHVLRTGSGYQAMCPTHVDRQPSLSLNPGRKGWMLYCHRGCKTADIMAKLELPIQALFYDYKPLGGARFSPHIDQNFSEWVDEAKPYSPCWKLHRFDDVAWAGIQREPSSFAAAGAEWFPYTGDPFERTISMWVVMSDGWLFQWLGKWYSETGMDWKETKQWAHQRILKAWIDQGCSTCPSVESPRPVLGL